MKWLVCKVFNAAYVFGIDNRKFGMSFVVYYYCSKCLWCAPVRDTSCIIVQTQLIADDFHFLFHVKNICVLIAISVHAAHNLLFHSYFIRQTFRSFICFYFCSVIYLFVFFLFAKEMCGVCVCVSRWKEG